MNIFNKIITMFRGALNEAGESITDSQALRILDQEIRDTDTGLQNSRQALAEMMAKHKVAQSNLDKKFTELRNYESLALEAIEKGQEGLALEVASKIGALETTINSERNTVDSYERNVTSIREAIREAEEAVKQLKVQADSVRATDSVQRAQEAVSGSYASGNNALNTAVQSLERIKQRQEEKQALMESSRELEADRTGSDLNKRLAAAGIGTQESSAQEILSRLRSKAAAQNADIKRLGHE